MASVLFSTVGQAVGGPLGAGIGAAVGATVDRSLYRRGRRGAEDGFASRSSYGETVPMVFGRTRVGGHLIWATAPASAGSKGQGRRAQANSFAMAVSRGPIAGIGRIWADGALLRTREGALRTKARLRIHSQGDAEPDPLIVAAEGPSAAPAYTHLSYVVFEGFDLGPYGNRIPSLSFEVIADGGEPLDWLGRMMTPLGVVVEARPGLPSISGYAAWFDSFADDVGALLDAAGARAALRGGRTAIVTEPKVVPIAMEDLVPGEGAGTEGMLIQDPRPAGIGLSFQDSDREYQLGWQQETRGGRGHDLAVSWPAASTASIARTIAYRLLQDAIAGSERISVALPHRFLEASVGDVLTLGDRAKWLVVGREVRGLGVYLEGRRLAEPLPGNPLPTDSGRVLESPTSMSPASIVVIVEPPLPIGPSASDGSILVLASGGEGWRGADVRLLRGGDEVSIGTMAEGLPFGRLVSGFGSGPTTIWDEQTALMIDTSTGRDLFLTRQARDVLDGGGLVCVGNELIQYREASAVSPGLVRLSGLLRGRFATCASGAPAGALVMAVPRGEGASVQAERDSVGRDMTFLIDGPGDPPGGTLGIHRVLGAGWAPLAPVHVRAVRLPGGALCCSWIERDRANWRWETDEPSGVGRYAWYFRDGAGRIGSVAAMSTGICLEPDDQIAAFGGLLTAGEFRVEAVGDGPDALRFTPWMTI